MERKKTAVELKKEWKFYTHEDFSSIAKQWEESIIITKYKGTESDVIVPAKIGSRPVRVIDEFAFSGNQTITSVTIPESVIGVGEGVFQGCTTLKRVEILSKKILLREHCFCDCPSLEEIHLNIESAFWGRRMFQNCPKMMDQNGFVIVEDGDKKFLLDIQLPIKKETVVIPDGVTHLLGESLSETYFDEYPNVCRVKKVVLPESVMEIGDSFFADCKSLESVNIPNGIIKIGELAFCYCGLLQGIDITNDKCKIGACAFFGCENLGKEELLRYNDIRPQGRRDLLFLNY